MTRYPHKRKCKHCHTSFIPDVRNVGRQRYGAQPACRKASKAASQQRWLSHPTNRDYFSGPTQVERVRQWRQAHPGYGRSRRPHAPEAFQETFHPQSLENGDVVPQKGQEPSQDPFWLQPSGILGLIAHLSGLSLQEDIAQLARRRQQLGLDILHRAPTLQGGFSHVQASHLGSQTAQSPPTVQLDRSPAGP